MSKMNDFMGAHARDHSMGSRTKKFYKDNAGKQHSHDIEGSSKIIPYVVRTPMQTPKPSFKNTTTMSPINKVVKSYAKDGGPKMGSVRHGVKPSYPKSQHNAEMMRGRNGISHEQVHHGFVKKSY